MKNFLTLLFAVILLFFPFLTQAQTTSDPLTGWAYPWLTGSEQRNPEADPDTLMHVSGSELSFTRGQTKDMFFAPDWHPEEHPAMPDIVKFGRKPDVIACGVCHRADGPGGPENASINGLSAEYIIEQFGAFKRGTRMPAIAPNQGTSHWMRSIAQSISDAELQVAAQYFASIKPGKNIDVVEADLIPKVKNNKMLFTYQNTDEKEALGNRIIEVPNDEERFENRDSHSRFTAYVPIGSTAKGKYLAEGIEPGKTIQCALCHGAGLKGTGLVPRLAGRSPTYIARQLFDIKHGGRTGNEVAPMLAVVEKLNSDDLMSLAAYVASLSP